MAIGFCALALGVCLAAGEPIQVMTVGCMDGKADEFALAPDGWGKWGSSYGASVRFRAGIDDPARKFPFIHPGPVDAWAGHVSHTIQYDGLALLAYADGKVPAKIDSLAVEDTIFFKEEKGSLLQVLHVNVSGLWDGAGTLQVKAGEASFSVDARAAAFQDGVLEVCIPPVTKDTEVAVELVTAQGSKASAKGVARPHRQWQIFIAMKTHYDLGYTEPIDAMLERSSGPMLDLVEEYCDRGRSYSPDHRFIWTYPTWMIEEILRHKDEAGKKKFEDYIARGEITWHALPFTLHSYFCGLEDIARSLYGAKELERRYGKSVAWAKQTDVPGHTRVFPQILARSGVRLLQIGANNGVRGVKTPLLFWWESPDGSRVLTQLTDGYGWGWDQNRLARSGERSGVSVRRVPGPLRDGRQRRPGESAHGRDGGRGAGQALRVPEDSHRQGRGVRRLDRDARQGPGAGREDRAQRLVDSRCREPGPDDGNRAAGARESHLERASAQHGAALRRARARASTPRSNCARATSSRCCSASTPGASPASSRRPSPPQEDDLAHNKEYDAMKLSWRLKGDFARRAAKIGAETVRLRPRCRSPRRRRPPPAAWSSSISPAGRGRTSCASRRRSSRTSRRSRRSRAERLRPSSGWAMRWSSSPRTCPHSAIACTVRSRARPKTRARFARRRSRRRSIGRTFATTARSCRSCMYRATSNCSIRRRPASSISTSTRAMTRSRASTGTTAGTMARAPAG